MQLRFLCAALLLGSCTVAHALKQGPIHEATDHPEVVLIQMESPTKRPFYCCGALVAPQVVLTAAHCVKGFEKWRICAPYALHGPITVRCKHAVTHPSFREGSVEHDVGLLILDGKIAIGRAFPRLYKGELLRLNEQLVVLGRVDNGALATTKAFTAKTSLVEFPGDLNVYGGHPNVTQPGDSGGPVFVSGWEQEIVAVISGGLLRSRANVPLDRYSPISRTNRAWILEQISKVR
jgi:hypothetical protein